MRRQLDEEVAKVIKSKPERLNVKPGSTVVKFAKEQKLEPKVPRWPKRRGFVHPITGPESVPFNGYYVRLLMAGDLALCTEDEVKKAEKARLAEQAKRSAARREAKGGVAVRVVAEKAEKAEKEKTKKTGSAATQ